MIKQYVTFIVRHPIWIILGVVGVTLLFAFQFRNLEKVLDPKRILPQGHPYVKLNNEIERRFGGSRVVVIGVVAKEGDIFNPNILGKIKRITEGVKEVPGILEENVVSIADRKIKAIIASPQGLEIKRLMEKVPENDKEMKELRDNIFDNDLYVGSLVSPDGRAAAIITDFQGGAALEEFWARGGTENEGGVQPDGEKYPADGKGDVSPEKPWEKWQGKAESEPQGEPHEQKEEPWKKWQQENPTQETQPDSKENGAGGITQNEETWGGGQKKEPPSKEKLASEAESQGEEPSWKKWQTPAQEKVEGGEDSWKQWADQGENWYISDSTIYANLSQLVSKEKDSTVEIHIGGLPVALAFLEADTSLMNRVVFPLAFFVIMIVLYFSFRSFQGMIIPIFTALMSVIWAIGLMGMFRVPLDPWTQTLTPILIVAIAAGHSLQILKRYYEEFFRLGSRVQEGNSVSDIHRSAVVESTSKMIPVMATAGFVAAISFASLITFELKTFQSFGLLTAFGILSAVVLEMTFIPAFRILLRPPALGPSMGKKGFLDNGLGAIARLLTEGSPKGGGAKTTLWVAVAIALFSSVSASQVKVNNSLKSQFFEGTQFRQDDAALNQSFGGTSTFYVLIQSQQPEALKDPQVMRDIEGLQKIIGAVPDVGKTQSFVDYIKKMNRSLHGGDDRYDAIPQTEGEVGEFLFLYAISGNPADFDRLVDYNYQSAVIWAFLKSDSTELAEELIKKVNQYAEEHFQGFRVIGLKEKNRGARPSSIIEDIEGCGVQESCLGVAGSAPVTVALNKTMVEGKVKNVFQIALIAFIVSTLVLRSLLGGVLVLLPLALAVLINFGVMGLTGITLGIGTAAISAMAVGMGADYAIYILFRLREEWKREGDLEKALGVTLTTAGKAVLTVAFAISAGCFTLVFPGYYLHMEGILVPLAMLTSSVGAVTILPALVFLLKPKFLSRGLRH
jgi:hypothetical protein